MNTTTSSAAPKPVPMERLAGLVMRHRRIVGAIWLAVIARRDGGLLTPASDAPRVVSRATVAEA